MRDALPLRLTATLRVRLLRRFLRHFFVFAGRAGGPFKVRIGQLPIVLGRDER